MAKRKNFSRWKSLTKEEEAMIIMEHGKRKRKLRSKIIKEFGITSDQYCFIIRKTGVKI